VTKLQLTKYLALRLGCRQPIADRAEVFEKKFDKLILSQLLPAIDEFVPTLSSYNLHVRIEEFNHTTPTHITNDKSYSKGLKICLEGKNTELKPINPDPPILVFAINRNARRLKIFFNHAHNSDEQLGNLSLMDFELVKYKLIQLLSFYLFDE